MRFNWKAMWLVAGLTFAVGVTLPLWPFLMLWAEEGRRQ